MKTVKIISLSSLLIFVFLTSAFTPASETHSLEKAVAKKISFPEFLSHFEKVSMPFQVGLEDQWKYELPNKSKKAGKKSLEKKAPDRREMGEYLPIFSTGLYSRMGPPQVVPLARFYPNERSVAVIYMVYKRFWRANSGNYQMAIFDLKGNLINKEQSRLSEGFELARNSREETQTFIISDDGYIVKTKYKNIWRNDQQKKGVKDNQIIAYEKQGEETFYINEKGLVKAVKNYPDNSRASLD